MNTFDPDFDLIFVTGLPTGRTLQIHLAADPTFEHDGVTYLLDVPEWQDLPVATDPARCDHQGSACLECVGAWQCDWELRIV